ncbi:MAG: AMP-binding protein [Parerythrobacter sp.]
MSWPGAIAERTPDRIALVLGDMRMTYGELARRAERLAGVLAQRGCRTGDTVAIVLGNSPEFFIAAWAAQMSGLYFVPMSEKMPTAERDHILSDSGARIVLTRASGCAVALPPEEWDGLTAGFERIEGSDMLYTSGTTGKPKGVKRPLAGAPLGSDARRTDRARDLFGMDQQTVFLSPAPLYHAAPLRYAMTVQRLGGTVVAMERFDAARALELIAAEQVTHSQWVPTMFSRILALPDRPAANDHHVCAIHAGAPCPQDVKRRMIALWGPILHEYYSGTEAVGFTHITSAEWLERPSSVGRAYGSTIHILDTDDGEVPIGETGRVYFEGRTAHAYHGDPHKAAAATSAQGWATMGDIGHMDADGYLYLTDRAAFTIISGGANIYPAQVEEALMADPAVVDCAVFGVPDADLGEAVQAVVELAAGQASDAQAAVRMADRLREQVAGYKLPRAIAFVEHVPRMDSGKVRKRDLVEAYRDPAHRGFATRALEAAQ